MKFDPSQIQSHGPKGIAPAGSPGASRALKGNAPAFRALLENLQAQASDLRHEGESLSDPADLASAVDHARSSLEDAFSLRDQLLEAYRQNAQQGER